MTFPEPEAAAPRPPVTAESLREAYPDYLIQQSGLGRWWATPTFPLTTAQIAAGIGPAVSADDLEVLADVLFGQELRRLRHDERGGGRSGAGL